MPYFVPYLPSFCKFLLRNVRSFALKECVLLLFSSLLSLSSQDQDFLFASRDSDFAFQSVLTQFFFSFKRCDTSIFCTVTSSSNAQRRFPPCIGNPMRNRCKDLDSMPTLLQFQKAGVELQVRNKP